MATFSSNLLSIFSISLLLAISSSALTPQIPLQSFTQCFLNNKAVSSSKLITTSASSSYLALLESSAQNARFLNSSTYQNPIAIVKAATESHVSSSIVCARAQGLHVRARSGGHDYEAMSYASEQPFIMVDLSAFRKITVDAKSRTAWVQAGATLGEVYYNVFTRTNGTAGFPAGFCPTVGVGGHISGGGIGTLMRKYGLAADHVIDARVVGIDGQVSDRRAMGESLFWAIRGGGAASFGIIVGYKIKLVDVPPVVTVFNVTRNLRQGATKLVTRWQNVAPNIDENLYIRIDAQKITDNGNTSIQAMFNSLYLGNRSQLLSVMATSFPELGLTAENCTEMTWLQSALFMDGIYNQGVQTLLSRTPTSNTSFKAKSDFVTTPICENDWENIWKFLMADSSEMWRLIIEPFGGQMSRIPETATPFPHRQGILYDIQYVNGWFGVDAKETQKHLDWMRKMYDFMTPYVSKNPRRAYYNFKDKDLGESGSFARSSIWGEKYFKGNFKRLAYIKGKIDPHNFFRNEQSIPPLLAGKAA